MFGRVENVEGKVGGFGAWRGRVAAYDVGQEFKGRAEAR